MYPVSPAAVEMDWISENDPPKQGELVVVAAWDFECEPRYYFARMWQSSLDGQPRQWYLDKDLYKLDRPWMIGSKVRYWMELPEAPKEKPELFMSPAAVTER